MNNAFKLFFALSSAVLISSCAQNQANVKETISVDIPKAPLAPSKEEIYESQNIALLPFEHSASVSESVAKMSYSTLQQALLRSGANILEREVAEKLNEEVRASVLMGGGAPPELRASSLAIIVDISSASTTARFSERETWRDDDGDLHVTPARCNYKGKAKLHARVYKVPSMTNVGTYDLTGGSSSSSETGNSACPISENLEKNLKSRAISSALIKDQYELLNKLAPTHYVLERRQVPNEEDEAIFFTSLSEADGATAGKTVEFFRKEEKVNRLTEESYYEDVLLTSGTITEQISDHGSYVLVKDQANIELLMLGDVVKLVHEECGDKTSVFGTCIGLPTF